MGLPKIYQRKGQNLVNYVTYFKRIVEDEWKVDPDTLTAQIGVIFTVLIYTYDLEFHSFKNSLFNEAIKTIALSLDFKLTITRVDIVISKFMQPPAPLSRYISDIARNKLNSTRQLGAN